MSIEAIIQDVIDSKFNKLIAEEGFTRNVGSIAEKAIQEVVQDSLNTCDFVREEIVEELIERAVEDLSFAERDSVEEVDGRCDDLEERIESLESNSPGELEDRVIELESAPSNATVASDIEDLQREVADLKARLAKFESIAPMIEAFQNFVAQSMRQTETKQQPSYPELT
jgi:polyhydroxyalkanoate synthesis regulator phasin